VTPYLDDMAAQFAAADLILCRSGASSVAEVGAAGRAAVLIPFPQAADDHQRKNAEAFVAAGAAELILEAELTPERLLQVLTGLLSDSQRRVAMGERARALAHPQAVREIAGRAVELAR
jgi:UDP-N-acetylglucosamine--N-acetylmuramyl-(pentapeptide) pyrophosphoryl-undecaprenol N-acetylglucosamine transferase